jgi:two-component system osmolarity sensor histidine kinase EnvZ
MKPFARFFRRLAPKTLFARALLIMVLPILLLQCISVYIFYDRHWASVTRQLSSSLAGEVTWLVEHWEYSQDANHRRWLALQAKRNYGLGVTMTAPMRSESPSALRSLYFPVFEEQLRDRINRPFAMRYQEQTEQLNLLVPIRGGMLSIVAPKKRLAGSTNLIFIGWMVGSSALLVMIATLFLRNQIRPIVQLSRAAEQFGLGQQVEGFRPSGAHEVRQAARAFLKMRDRISRQVESRTAMLAGISHDLRTPLTRMRLELEMLGDSEDIQDLQKDVSEMQQMVNSYLTFASGESGEEPETLPIDEWIQETIAPYQRRDAAVRVSSLPKRSITLKPQSMSRAIRNLIDNALRYGSHCWVGVKLRRKQCIITIDDDGPGIPEEKHEEVFRAFKRLEDSRNSETGGAGLGLSIVRDSVYAHGGEITLEGSKHGGLRVVAILPL